MISERKTIEYKCIAGIPDKNSAVCALWEYSGDELDPRETILKVFDSANRYENIRDAYAMKKQLEKEARSERLTP